MARTRTFSCLIAGPEKECVRRALVFAAVAMAIVVAGLAIWSEVHVRSSSPPSFSRLRGEWSPAAAATYLDSRESWWLQWPHSQRDEGTVCISCHTALPYAQARPMLRAEVHQAALTPMEGKMLADIEKRVRDWPHVKPWYPDPAHAAPSRATEAVLNAVILESYEANPQTPGPLTHESFDEAWALQEKTGPEAGGWLWQDFHEAPWESSESAYQGAALMALAAGMAGDAYDGDAAAQRSIKLLHAYIDREYETQPVLNRIYVLWASAKVPGLLSSERRSALLRQLAALQNADGGWSLPALDPQHDTRKAFLNFMKRVNSEDGSDGCATGLTILAMELAGSDANDPTLQRGLEWIQRHQAQDGSWWASSLNGFRDPQSGQGRFMSDAATGYSVLALEEASRRQQSVRSPRNAMSGD
jgi:squalene-hopene/tetraprenyl-beta-curcumene cyclase